MMSMQELSDLVSILTVLFDRKQCTCHSYFVEPYQGELMMTLCEFASFLQRFLNLLD